MNPYESVMKCSAGFYVLPLPVMGRQSPDLAATISLFHVALAFMPAFVSPRRFHPDFAPLLLLRVMSLVNNVTARRGRLTHFTPFRERL